MKTHSTVQLPTYEPMGRMLRIHFDEQQSVTQEGEEAERSEFIYTTAVVEAFATRDVVIEAIMKTRYPTYGAELAAMRNGGEESQVHNDTRDLAKVLADGRPVV